MTETERLNRLASMAGFLMGRCLLRDPDLENRLDATPHYHTKREILRGWLRKNDGRIVALMQNYLAATPSDN